MTATLWRNYSVAQSRADGLAWGLEIAAGILPETFCARSVSRLTITCHRAEPRRQMSRCGRRRQMLFRAVNTPVPWSSLWQRVILASSTSGPGWSRTCLHHCRGLRRPSSCSSALGLMYNLARHKNEIRSSVRMKLLLQAAKPHIWPHIKLVYINMQSENDNFTPVIKVRLMSWYNIEQYLLMVNFTLQHRPRNVLLPSLG